MHKRLPPLNALRAFEVTARHSSFSKAAEELFVTRAAVSQQVKLLEDYLGELLFLRQNRQLVLTDTGRSYLPILSSAFAAMLNGTQTLFAGDSLNTVRVRAGSSFCQRFLMPRLPSFYRRHPSIKLKLLATIWRNSPELSEDVDVEISSHFEASKGAISEKLGEERLLVVANADCLARQPFSSVEQLLQQPRIHVCGYTENWQTWASSLGHKDDVKEACLETDSSTLAIEAASAGVGYLLARSFSIMAALEKGDLQQVHAHTIAVSGGHYLNYPSKEPGVAVQLFCQWLKEEVANAQKNDLEMS